MKLYKVILLLSFAIIGNAAHALVMPDTGSSLVIDKAETLYVNDGDVFDLSSLDITHSGGIDIFGNTQNASFSIIANSFINIGGYLNLFVSNTTLQANDISFSGIINVIGGGQITFSVENSINFSGSMLFNGVPLPLPPSDGPLTGPTPPPKVILSSVPETESYALLLAGLAVIMIRRRHLV